MAKTYRALGIVAIVTLLVLIAQIIIIANSHIQGLPAPASAIDLNSAPLSFYITAIWPLVARQFAPIIATFSIVVAGQSRQWGWLAAFIVTGIIGVFGPAMFFFFPATVGVAAEVGASPNGFFIVQQLVTEVIPPAIPALAALVFAWLSLRAGPSARRAAPQQGQA
jgi:hypothetical protein